MPESSDLCKPFPQSDTLVDGWKRGDLIFHLKIGIISRRDAAEFCADLQYSPAPSRQGFGDFAVPNLCRLPGEALGEEINGLKRPVLIEVVQVHKDGQGVKRPVPLGVSIRLRRSDDCGICTTDARQLSGPSPRAVGEGFIEGVTRFTDRERDGSPLPTVQRRGRSATARDDSPREVVESTPVVVGDGTQSQAEPRRRRRDVVEREDEPVTLRVVVTPNGVQPLKLLVIDEVREVSLEKFGFSYRPAPLQPSAVKESVHGGESTTNPPSRQTRRAISQNPPKHRFTRKSA